MRIWKRHGSAEVYACVHPHEYSGGEQYHADVSESMLINILAAEDTAKKVGELWWRALLER